MMNVAEHGCYIIIHIQLGITEFHIITSLLQVPEQRRLLIHPLHIIIKGFIVLIPVSGQNIGYRSLGTRISSHRIFKISKIPENLIILGVLRQQFRNRSGIHRV